MSEALVKKPPPQDFPIAEAPEKRVNVRMAMAGIYLMQGFGSLTRCLVQAGFSRATARNLQSNGLTAKRCLDEAIKLDPNADPAKLLEGGRRRLAESIAFIDPKTVPLRDVVRMFEATEKYFGGHQISPVNTALSMADRLAGLVSYLVVARERGLPVPELPREYVEAKVISESVTSTADATKSVDVAPLSAPASDNSHYVNHPHGPLSPRQRDINGPRPDICPNY